MDDEIKLDDTYFLASLVSAVGLALFHLTTCVGTIMPNFGSCIYFWDQNDGHIAVGSVSYFDSLLTPIPRSDAFSHFLLLKLLHLS